MVKSLSFKPTLPQLLALDTDYSNFEERLRQAALLAGLPGDWLQQDAETHGEAIKSHHRAEWVLRWLLEKLKGLGVENAAFPVAWTLLQRLILHVPISNSARLLNANTILSTIETVLQSLIHRQSKDVTTSLSRKRKRNGDSKIVETVSGYGLLQSLNIVANVLRTIVSLSSGDDVSCEHMKAVLRTTTVQAARLLNAWLSLLQGVLKDSPAATNSLLDPMLHVWNSRALEADDENGSSMSAFTSECLVGVAKVYAQLKELIPKRDFDFQDSIPESLRVTEQLIAKHLLLPSHSAFLAAHRSRSVAPGYAMNGLMSSVQTLKVELRRISAPSSGKSDNRLLLTHIAPDLFELALNIAPRGSISQKDEETAWAETLFTVFADCAGLPIPEDPKTSFPPDTDITTLVELILVIKEAKRELSSGFCERILIAYSGLVQQQQEAQSSSQERNDGNNARSQIRVQWDLVSTILEIDGGIFLPTSGTLGQSGHSTNLAEPLIQAISARRFSSLHTESQRRHSQELRQFTELITMPLMQVYANGRDLVAFIKVWSEGLRVCASDDETCAWSDERLIGQLRSLLEGSMTASQIVSLLEGHLQTLLSTEVTSSTTPDATIIDAILQSINKDETIQRALPSLQRIRATFLGSLDKIESKEAWHWRNWRILTSAHELLFEGEGSETVQSLNAGISENTCLEAACKVISLAGDKEHPPSSLYGFIFVLSICSHMLELPGLESRARGYLNESCKVMRVRNLDDLGSSIDFNDPNLQARIHDFSCALLRFPTALLAVDSHTRRSTFATLFEYSPEDKNALWLENKELIGATFGDILDILQDIVLSLGSQELRDDYIQAFCYVLMSSHPPNLMLEHLLRFPSSAIPRKDREAILDTIVRFAELESNHSINLEDGTLSMSNLLPLATHLMESPNLTSRLCTDPRVIFNIANYFDELSAGFCKASDATDRRRNESPILPIESHDCLKFITLNRLRNLEALMSAVLKQVASDPNVERRQGYHTEVLKQLWSHGNNDDDWWAHKVHQNGWYRFGSCSIAFALLSTIEDWNAINIGVRSFAEAFSRQSTKLFQQGTNLVENGDPREAYVFFDLWYATRTMNLSLEAKIHGADHGNTTPFNGNNDGREYQTSNFKLRELLLERSRLHRSNIVSKLPKELHHQIQIEAYRLLTKTGDWDEAFDGALLLLRRELDPHEYSGVLSIWLDFVMGEESPSKRGMKLERLWRDEPDKQTLELLHVVIQSLQPLREESKNKYTTTGTFLEGLLPRFCRIVRNASSIAEFSCSIASVQSILRTKTWIVTQYGVDSSLVTLVEILSPRSILNATEHGGLIYLRLCQTTNYVISLHRKNLGGRFHTLLLLLQKLLACLFVPHAHNALSFTRPTWLPPRNSPLTTEHATAFTRILTTLCSPTVSSASTHRRRAVADLVDETKKARTNAGQYVPQLLTYYCCLQLSGKLSAQVKDALRPGLWAMMDVVDMNTMRAMNASMGKDERALWGSLYGEWKKFGKWHEK